MRRAARIVPAAEFGFGVGYTRVPRLGAIEALHAVDPDSGRTMCGRAVAISWSAQDASGTAIDCWRCQAAIHRVEEPS
jgi:hypothetical protein